MHIQSFKEIIDSNDLKRVKSFLDSGESWVLLEEDTEILQYCLKKKSYIEIFKLIFNRLKNSKKDKILSKASKDDNSTLFLALDAGEDYFEVFKNYKNVDWSILDKNGNNLLHHALSLEEVSEELLNFLYEKLGGCECLFRINDDNENALHCAKSLKNFKWCLDKYKTSDPSKVKSLLHSINRIGETPVIKQLSKDKASLDEALLKEITDVLRENEYDFLKTDDNEQNAINLAVKNSSSILLDSFLYDINNSYKKEKNEIIFSAIENGKDDLLKILEIKDKSDFIVQNFEELSQKYPKRIVNLIANEQSILSDCIKLYGTRNGHFTSDKLFSVLRRAMNLAVDYTNDNLADQCLTEHRLLKNYVSFYENNLVISDSLEKQNITDETILDYTYRSNPEIFAKLVQRLPEFKLDISLRSSFNHEHNDSHKKEEIDSSIASLFVSDSCEWYDTGGVLASLADLVIRESKESDNSPKIFVQPGTDGEQLSLSDELKKVSECGQDVIYIRRNPVNKEGESSPHWVVFYFFQCKNGKRNLLLIDPYKISEPSTVIKKASNGIIDNIYVSTTKIQHDNNSCGLISSEVARAIYFQRGRIQELLKGNNQKIDIEQILPNGLIKDAKENGRVDYGRGFENFNCSKIRNVHIQTAQAIGETILNRIDAIPSQVLINKILTGKENSIDEQTATLGRDSINDILNLCSGNDFKIKREIISILTGKNITTDETLDREITLLLSQDEAKVNQQQVEKLEQVLDKEQFKHIKERLNAQIQQPQLLQLSNDQKKKIRQIRRNFELELMNVTPEKYKGNDSLLYKFLCSAAVDEIEQFFNSDNNIEKGQALSKAAFTAARNGSISRIKVFIKCKSDIIYEKDISGKSLLEVAAESLHPEIVQYIIYKHNETYKNQNDKIEDDVSSKFLGFVDNIDNKKDPWAKNLAKELKRILKKKGFDETDRLKISRIFSAYTKDKERQEKIVKDIGTNNYSDLAFYVDILKSSDIERFKTALDKIYPKRNLYSLLSSDGHNLITLTCALGTPSHWKEIEKAYSKIDSRAVASASLDNSSSVGSTIQAAIIANNLPMFNHFFYSKDEFIIDEQYGAEQNNILHTILQSDKVELLNDMLFKFKDNKKPFIKALQQLNKDGKSPLDLALEKSRYGFFERALDVITSYNKKVIRDLLIANDCGLIKSAVSFGNETIVKKIFDLQDEYNKGVKDQLNLLNYSNKYDKENRIEKSELLNLACKSNNKQVANCLLKLLMDKEKVSDKILVNALTASIFKDFSNKEIFDFLFNQGIDFNTLSKEITAQYSPIHRAVEYGNVGALGYFVNRFPKNNILDLQDESGRTPLHLAISSSDRETVEFLIENGADFDKPNNIGVTPFELALENSKFADVCIDLLKSNPRATMPIYRAISSGNESLIKSLIDQNDWVLDQCDADNAVRNRDFINEETVLKFALRSKIDKDLTADIADKSIENFKKLDNESQKNLLKLGFLNDLLKSSIYDLYPDGSKKVGKISEFIKSAIKRDCSLLSITSQGTTLLYDIASSGNFNLLRDIKINVEDPSIAKESSDLKETALHAAVRSDNINMVKTIVKTISSQKNIKLAINKYSVKGYTPFQMAAQLGNWEIYNFLKEKGGDLKSKTKDGNSIAHLLILSAMKDPHNMSYKYQELLRDYPELVKSINSRGDDLLATAARCTKQDEASKIMEKLLENEFKYKKNQLKEEDAVKLLSSAISANNFVVVRNIVLDNIKERVSFTSKVASIITRVNNDNISRANVLRGIVHAVTSKKKIHGINESRVLSQSIQKALLDTEEQKWTLSRNILNFLNIKLQKSSSSEMGIRTLLNFLIEDQSSYIKSIGGLPYQSSTNLSKIHAPQDALYVDCTDLVNGSLSDPTPSRSDLPLINKVILENKDLLDPEFTDSKGNTLLHKLAQIVKINKFEGNNLEDYIQLFIDRGFSLTRKNNDGESAKDIFENILSKDSDKEAINSLSEKLEAEQQAQKHLKKRSNLPYWRATFNLFHDVISSCFNGDLSNDYLFNKKLNCFEKLLKNNDLRTKLDSFDERGCNFLHKAIEEATNNYSGSSTNKMLKKILLDVARELNDRDSINRDPRLYNELFFKQRNSEGSNVIEALSKVRNSLDIFRELEEEFGRKTFADECDLDLILVNAASSKNSSLFEHVIENYRLNGSRTTSNGIQSPLHAAVISGDQKTVLAVLKSGANINQINSSGRTALHELLIFLRDNSNNQANNQEHEDLVYYLASRGAFFYHYQKEEENKGCEFSEVIESMNEDIQKKVLFNIAYGRSAFYNLKFSLLNEAENFIKSKNRNIPLVVELDVSGSTAFVRINNGKFKSSKFLNSDICKSNHLTTSYFDVDGCKGYVQKSVGGKRNYVIFEDAIDDGKKNHPTKIKVWLSKEQSITVLVSADGTIEPAMTSYKVMGLEIKDNLLEYRERKGEFKKNHKEYEDYMEKLWEKVDSQNEYKNDVYIGGIPLKEALIQGCWRSKVLERQSQENKILEIRKSPGDHEMPSYSKGNSEDDVVGKTIGDAKIYQQDLGKTGQDLNQLQSMVNNSATDNSNSRAFVATEEGRKNFYKDLMENIDGIEVCSKNSIEDKESENTHSQNEHHDSDEFVIELKEGFAQPYKKLKRVDSSEYYVNPKTPEGLIIEDSLKERANSKYLESKKSNNFNSQILNSQGVKSIRPQQIKIFTCMEEKKLPRDTGNRELYSRSLKLVEGIKDLISKAVDEFNYLKLSKMIEDILSQMSDQSEVLNQNNAFYSAVTELTKKLEVIIKESTNNNLLDKTKSIKIFNKTYNRIVLLICSLNSLISKIAKSNNSLKLRESVDEYTIKVLDNNKEKYVDLSIEKEIQKACDSNQKLPKSFEELKNKYPKLYEIVIRNLRDIEEGIKEIVLDTNYDDYVNSSNVSIPSLKFESDSESLTQEEKRIKDNYESEKSEIDVSLMGSSRIELRVKEEQNSISLIRKDQEKENSCKIEKQNKIQLIIENLAPTQKQNTKNHMGLKVKGKFNLLSADCQNDKNLKILKRSHIPVLSSCNNKRGRIR